MKIALLADLHLPDSERNLKEEVLDWALRTAKHLKVDRIVGVGDLTATGSVVAAKRLRSKLAETGIPFLLTPGNAEMRSPDECAQVQKILATAVEDGCLLLLDSSRGRLSDPARALLKQNRLCGVFAVTHCPPDIWPEEDRRILEEAFHSGRIRKLVAGHAHCDATFEQWEIIRGLDPDKAAGGAPALVIFDGNGNRLEDCIFSDADLRRWSWNERRKILDFLGCSGMNDPIGILERGIGEGLKIFELRYTSMTALSDPVLRRALNRLQAEAGHVLSLHLPDFGWRDGEIRGKTELENAAQFARETNCSRVTLHVPRVSQKEFQSARDALAAAVEVPLRRLLTAGIEIGIENLHIAPGESAADRNFGCTPAECRMWIEFLRKNFDCGSHLGFHFDLGHARNNGTLATRFTISDWLEELGSEINGFHLHQVTVQPDGSFRNHMPLTEPFGQLISLASLFLAWKRRLVKPSPMFLEIREGDPLESRRKLLAALQS